MRLLALLCLLVLAVPVHADELRVAAYGDTRARGTATIATTLTLPAGLSHYGFTDLTVNGRDDPVVTNWFMEQRLDRVVTPWLSLEGEVNVLPGAPNAIVRAGPVLHHSLGPLHGFLRLFPGDSTGTAQASVVILGWHGPWELESFVDLNLPHDGADEFWIAEAELRYWFTPSFGLVSEFRHDTTGGGDGVGFGVAYRWTRP